jgi:hypothetical protein
MEYGGVRGNHTSDILFISGISHMNLLFDCVTHINTQTALILKLCKLRTEL